MNVAQLIELLKELPEELEVVMWDDESQVVVSLSEAAGVNLGQYGHELVGEGEGQPALLLLNEAQTIETVAEAASEMSGALAALEEDPAALHGKFSLGLDDKEPG